MILTALHEQLIQIAQRLEPEGVRLVVGGGYGLVLKTELIHRVGFRTRFEEISFARSTNDLDLLLTAEIITSVERTEAIRDALSDLEYAPVVNYFQFQRQAATERPEETVKVDLLAAPPKTNEQNDLVQVKAMRIRPKNATKIHAYLTKEAVTLDEELIPIELESNGKTPTVYLPHPYTYLMLKLFALRDRINEQEGKDAYHAFDIYHTVGMMTEVEFQQAEAIRDKYVGNAYTEEAATIGRELFGRIDAPGVFKIRQHAQTLNIPVRDKYLQYVVEDIAELFPVQST